MARLEQLPDDLVFYTQITMEAAEDTEFLDAMRRAHIRGALVGIESVTPEGLKAVYKDFNDAGDALVTRLQRFRKHGVHVLGSFIFGLPTDNPATFPLTASLAQSAGISFAQFVMLQPLPGTVDFGRWEKDPSSAVQCRRRAAVALLADPVQRSTEDLHAASDDDLGSDPRGHAVDLGRVLQPAARLAALVVRQVAEGAPGVRAAVEALSADVREHRDHHRQRARRPVGEARPGHRQARPAAVRGQADAGPEDAGGQWHAGCAMTLPLARRIGSSAEGLGLRAFRLRRTGKGVRSPSLGSSGTSSQALSLKP